MVISLAGASSTGKTTQISSFERVDSIMGLEVVTHPEYPRILYEEKYKDQYKSFNDILMDPKAALIFQLEVCEQSLEVLDKAYRDKDKIHIIDGSVISSMVYLCLNYSNASPEVQTQYGTQFVNMMERLENSLYKVDRIIRLHPFNTEMMSGVVNDGFRPQTYSHRRFYELKLFDMVCGLAHDKCNNVFSDSVTVRFEEIMSTITYLIKYRKVMNKT